MREFGYTVPNKRPLFMSHHFSAQVSNRPPPPALCLHEECLEGGPAVYTLIQCTSILVEKADVAPDMPLKFTTGKQVRMQAREPPWL